MAFLTNMAQSMIEINNSPIETRCRYMKQRMDLNPDSVKIQAKRFRATNILQVRFIKKNSIFNAMK